MAKKLQLHGSFPSKAGDSAYQVAVNNGFEGTETEWLKSLVGPQGPAGTDAASELVVQVTDTGTALVADKTYDEIVNAYQAGKDVRCNFMVMVMSLVRVSETDCAFTCVHASQIYTLTIAFDGSVVISTENIDLDGYATTDYVDDAVSEFRGTDPSWSDGMFVNSLGTVTSHDTYALASISLPALLHGHRLSVTTYVGGVATGIFRDGAGNVLSSFDAVGNNKGDAKLLDYELDIPLEAATVEISCHIAQKDNFRAVLTEGPNLWEIANAFENTSTDSTTGERSVTLNPGDDIQAAVDAGYSTIVLNAGQYIASPVVIRNKDCIKLVVPDAGYDERKMKKNAVIDNSIDLTTVAGDTVLTAAFTADESSNWYKVFVSQTLPPVRPNLRSTSYNAILWESDSENSDNDAKLIPVLTLTECESTAGSFYYSHSEGTVYINPLVARDTNVYKRLSVEEGSIFCVENVNTVYMENIEVKYPPDYVKLNKISNFTAVSCVVSHTAYGGGFGIDGINGVFRDCVSYKVCADGFGIGGNLNGYTEYYNCSGHHCYDDGISHHNGSAGAIYGGVWHHNGKAGIAPAHGSIVNVYDAIAHDNTTGFFSKSDATVPSAMGRHAYYFNCVAYNNKYGIAVKNYHVTTCGCVFRDNDWSDTSIDSGSDAASTSLTIIPVDDGSVDLSGYMKAPDTASVGQTIVVKAVDENGKPTEWEAADLQGGGSQWQMIGDVVTTEEVNVLDVTGEGAYDELVGFVDIPIISDGNGAAYLFALMTDGAIIRLGTFVVSATTRQRASVHIHPAGGLCTVQTGSYSVNNNARTIPDEYAALIQECFKNGYAFAGLRISRSADNLYPADTKVTFWGR